MNEHLYITGCIATYILYCYFWRVFLLNAPTFIVCPIPPFLVYVNRLPTTASVGDPLVWHKYPAASWWSDLLPLPNLLVSFPLPVRETGRCGVGRKGVWVAVRSVSGSGTRPLQADGHKHCYGCWGSGRPTRKGHRDPTAASAAGAP